MGRNQKKTFRRVPIVPAPHSSFENGEWRMCASACRGTSHLRDGIPCQDKVLIHNAENGLNCVLLADGAGSARFSHFGAERTLQTSAAFMGEHFDDFFRARSARQNALRGIFDALRTSLLDLALQITDSVKNGDDHLGVDGQSRCCRLADLASTLLLVAVKGNRFVALHVGDGIIGVRSRRYKSNRCDLRLLSGPDNGEFANETYFVTSNNLLGAVRIRQGLLRKRFSEITGFILMSDGPEASLFRKKDAYLSPACEKLIDACAEMPGAEMRQQLDGALTNVIGKRTQDDCSIALLARKSMD